MADYILPLQRLIEQFGKLPGIGRKTALRLALAVLDLGEEQVSEFAAVIVDAKKEIKKCSVCANICTGEICDVCDDDSRDHSLVCVVEDAKAVFNKLNMVCEKFLNETLEVIQYLPEDITLEKAVRLQKPFTLEFPKSNISNAIKELANKIYLLLNIDSKDKDEEIEIEDVKVKSKKGIMGLLNAFIRKDSNI